MTLSKKLQQKAEHLASLLVKSPLDPVIKDFLIDNLGDIPEDRVTGIISVLEQEHAHLEDLNSSIRAYLTRNDTRWSALAAKQKEIARKFIALKTKETS
jgi:hypothetical protein